MLCSLPAVKSGPNWLDRLRSNKGFPIGDDLTLDHFLNNNQNLENPSISSIPISSIPISSNSKSNPNSSSSSSSSSTQNGHSESYNLITGILSDLFHIQGTSQNSNSSSKKFPRKQSNPKICSIKNDNFMDEKNFKEENILSSNSDNGLKGLNELSKVEEEDKCEKELIGFSKSEVTVIDTSCDVWKSDKLVFRRKNVWKVKEKKGKLRSYGRKKRKLVSESNDEDHNMIGSGTKKSKISGLEECFRLDSQRIRGKDKESRKLLNRAHNPQHCSGPEIRMNAPDSGNYIQENAYTVSPDGSYGYEKRSSGESSKRS